jgi:hypothetical protein
MDFMYKKCLNREGKGGGEPSSSFGKETRLFSMTNIAFIFVFSKMCSMIGSNVC